MTENTQIRARYAHMYAAGILALLAATVASAAWTNAPTSQSTMMDVSAIMSGMDTGALPVQGHVDAI